MLTDSPKRMMRRTVIVYHRADLDGKCAGAILKRRFPEAELVPYNYGDEFQVTDYRDARVIMVDCSLQPFDRMMKLADLCSLLWIDHHKSAIEEFSTKAELLGRPPFEHIVDTTSAGCELAWLYAYPGVSPPAVVWLLGRYDVWDHGAHEDVLAFQYGMRLFDWWPDDQEAWAKAFEDEETVRNTVAAGRVVLRYIEGFNRSLCHNAFEAEVFGLRCICLNAPRPSSVVFASVWDPEKHDAMLAFQQGAKVLEDSKKLLEDGTAQTVVEIDLKPLWNMIIYYRKTTKIRID